MINSKCLFRIALCSAVIVFCFPTESLQSQQTDNSGSSNAEVGRDNPFAKLVDNKILPVPATASEITGVEAYGSDLVVQTVLLKFLDAESLKQAIDNMASEYGSIVANEKNNSLIVCDTEKNVARIMSEIKKADKTPQQITIEVVILDVELNDDTEVGINWDILSDERYDIGYRQNFTTSRIGSTPESSATIGNASAFNTTGLGGSFSVISGTVRNVVHLIQQKREVEILASPSVMVVSGESASIEAVEELPYTEVLDTGTGGAAAITYTKFKLVGVQMSVVATLTENDDIFLTVDAEQNVATGESDTEVPIVDTRKVNTSLLLKDGQIVVLGGLRRQEKTKGVNGIPILADLPIVGALFRSTRTITKNSELIVFLAPHIYKGEPVPDDAMSKYEEIKGKQMLSLQKDGDATETEHDATKH